MTENVENLILEHLRALREGLSRVEHTLGEIKVRLASLEMGQAGLRRDAADAYVDSVRQQSSIDQLAERVSRIEQRLEHI